MDRCGSSSSTPSPPRTQAYNEALAGANATKSNAASSVDPSRKGSLRVIISTAVFEPMVDVLQLLTNCIKFTEQTTLIVVHLNKLANYTEEEKGTTISYS